MRLRVVVRNARGDTLAAPASLKLASADSTVVQVDTAFTVKAVGMGETRVVASVLGTNGPLTDSLGVSVVCTLELAVHLTPIADTLTVGAGFTPSISVSTCGGQVQVKDTFVWTASDTAVIKVDPVTGQTTGLKPGPAVTFVRGVSYGALGGVFILVK
jgi:hypothetical protein